MFSIFLPCLLGLSAATFVAGFNGPPGVDVWCGKAYRASNSSFDPGGRILPPKPSSTTPLLNLGFHPRMSLYLGDEETGSFVVDTPLSNTAASPINLSTFAPGENGSVPFSTLKIMITNAHTGGIIVPWSNVSINSTGNEFLFPLSSLQANSSHHPVHLFAASPDGLQTYQADSLVTILPPRNDSGSVTRIDYLYGGLQVYSSLTSLAWKPIFPYSYYTSWDWIKSALNSSTQRYDLSTFVASNFNLIHPIPPGGSDPFDHALFEQFLQVCDTLELYVMYDMRHTYQNASSVAQQLARLQSHPSLLLYYTADEPDGATDPLSATEASYKLIKSIDPYHPVSLCLNCANFYFDEYTRGADIILEDVYPIAANTSFSTVYHTACNSTYGDCGCDNCHAGDPAFPAYAKNTFLDISTRLDDYANYQEWLGLKEKKPIWGVPQAFFDQGSFWSRYPTPEEEAVMSVLRINHGAKGLVAWMFPTETSLRAIASSLATVVGAPDVTDFTLGSKRIGLQVKGSDDMVDATIWIKGKDALVSIVHLGYSTLDKKVELSIPGKIAGLGRVLWGEGDWTIESESISKQGLKSLEITLMTIVLS